MAEQKPTSIEVHIDWHQDVYLDAEPVNGFLFTDFGEEMCFAFGFVPPTPNMEALVENGKIRLPNKRTRSFVMGKSTFVNMQKEMKRFIDTNPQLFAHLAENDEHPEADRR